jgi:hypothetical protein
LGLKQTTKEFVWGVVCKLPEVEMFKLAKPRNDLVIFDR